MPSISQFSVQAWLRTCWPKPAGRAPPCVYIHLHRTKCVSSLNAAVSNTDLAEGCAICAPAACSIQSSEETPWCTRRVRAQEMLDLNRQMGLQLKAANSLMLSRNATALQDLAFIARSAKNPWRCRSVQRPAFTATSSHKLSSPWPFLCPLGEPSRVNAKHGLPQGAV